MNTRQEIEGIIKEVFNAGFKWGDGIHEQDKSIKQALDAIEGIVEMEKKETALLCENLCDNTIKCNYISREEVERDYHKKSELDKYIEKKLPQLGENGIGLLDLEDYIYKSDHEKALAECREMTIEECIDTIQCRPVLYAPNQTDTKLIPLNTTIDDVFALKSSPLPEKGSEKE